jgi:hypothetical protein
MINKISNELSIIIADPINRPFDLVAKNDFVNLL